MASSSKNVEEVLLAAIRKRPQGVADDALARELTSISAEDRAQAVNRLVDAKRIQLYLGANNAIFYKEVAAEEAAKFKGLATEEMMIYQIIRAAGNTGVWVKDIRMRSNLATPAITKILKVLETGRGLVKTVKNVNNPSKKLYMLAELEPSRELTGGAWYTEQQFDTAFIEALREACLQFIERKGDTTLKEIASFIAAKKFAKVDLREEDVHSILQTLVYDGRIDVIESEDPNDDAEHYRPMLHLPPESTAFTSVPCGLCPVIDQCRDGGIISPATCEYYNKWLSF